MGVVGDLNTYKTKLCILEVFSRISQVISFKIKSFIKHLQNEFLINETLKLT